MYLGDILKATFPLEEFEEKFDAQKLTAIMLVDSFFGIEKNHSYSGLTVTADNIFYEDVYKRQYWNVPT